MNRRKKDYYNGLAKGDAERCGKTPFLQEFETARDLRLAHFNRASMAQFTVSHCDCDHDRMKSLVVTWIGKRDLDGIISINGDDDEVVVCRPVIELKQVAETALISVAIT